ncbi:MAG TPA: InlB B-repeat-containing protein [Bacillota bacterium]|nr:InlB B-repeat-containing protein [Bacillota bacterium]
MRMGKLLFVLSCAALLAALIASASAQAAEEYEYYYDGLKISSETPLDSYLSSVYSAGVRFVYLNNSGARLYVTLSGSAENVSFRPSGNVDITLDNLNMEVTRNAIPINLSANFNGTLLLIGSNTLVAGGDYFTALNLYHGAHASIVQATSEPAFLLAQGGPIAPGINVGRESDGSNPAILNIKSGTVSAIAGQEGSGGTGGAGIGGANGESGGVINISGGLVTAIGTKGAGIGGGNRSANGGEITITGGTVIACGTIEGAGIGGGDDDSDGGGITITGGFVTAIGGRLAAGIGGGNNGTSGKITISGGTVIATGGGGGAGIGGGHHDNNDGGNVDEILITGGVIFASGKDGGQDIGLGEGGNPDVGKVSLSVQVDPVTGFPVADPPQVFLRHNNVIPGIQNPEWGHKYTHVGPVSYEAISAYGIELSDLFGDPDDWPVIPGQDANWLTDLWTDQINHWKGETGNIIGAHLWLESIHYFEFEGPGAVFQQSQIYGTKGKILPLEATGFSAPEHYVFKTWKTSANQIRDPGREHTFLSELWLFPVWEPIQYQITYELNGGEFTTTYPTTYNIEDQTFTLINPAKTGYIFAGWTGTGIPGDDPVLEVVIDKGSTGDRAYTAHWTPIIYSVQYDANAEDATGTMAQNTHTYDLPANLAKNAFTRTGYSFAGWATSPGGDVVYADEAEVVNLLAEQGGTVTLYAQWTVIQYQITYYLNGGSNNLANPAMYTVEDELTLVAPTREGYIFTGWAGTGITGTSMSVTITKGSTGDRTYTAHWTLPFRTLTDTATGISVSGYIRSDAALAVGEIALHGDACEACNAIRQRVNDDDYMLLLGYDISLTQEYSGTLAITIPVDAQYNGLNVIILQCAAGTLHTYTATVAAGKAVFEVTTLSPFAVFAEDDDPPTVATGPVTKVSATGATFNGSVIDDGGAEVIERGFVYGKKPDPVISSAGVTKVAAGSGTGSFTAALTNLEPDTTYYVRVYATNSEGTAYGAVVSFTTGRDDRGDLPGTGHGGTPWIWLLLFGASAAVLVALLVLSKRRKAIER